MLVDELRVEERGYAQNGRNCDNDAAENGQEISDAVADHIGNYLDDYRPASIHFNRDHEQQNADDRGDDEPRDMFPVVLFQNDSFHSGADTALQQYQKV